MTDDQAVGDRGQEPGEMTSDSKFRLQEYAALRAEILTRTTIQHQLLSLSVVALGTFLTVGFERSSTLLLFYPVPAMFLAASWSQHDIRIAQLGLFIQMHHEAHFVGEQNGWEYFHRSSSEGKVVGSRTGNASRGILIGSQLVAVTLAIFKTTLLTRKVFVVGLDTVLIIVVIVLDAVLIAFTVHLLRGKQ